MDLHVLHTLSLKKLEHLSLTDTDSSTVSFDVDCILFAMIKLFIAGFAAYISWNCSKQYDLGLRIIFAFFAATFGSFYILMHVIFTNCYTKCKI